MISNYNGTFIKGCSVNLLFTIIDLFKRNSVKSMSVFSIVFIIGSAYVGYKFGVDDQNQQIGKLQDRNLMLLKNNLLLERTISDLEFSNKQIMENMLLYKQINAVDAKNNQITKDENSSFVHINTTADSTKLNKLESNKTYTIDLN